jgi:hypothetical protein
MGAKEIGSKVLNVYLPPYLLYPTVDIQDKLAVSSLYCPVAPTRLIIIIAITCAWKGSTANGSG